MSYRVYTTEALVVGSFANNTADKSFLLFTKDAGMLYASARSVREERSKQRYALQDFSLITVSLVKGKSGWRIGSVETRGNIFTEALTREARGSVVRLLKLIRRYVQGEESHPTLYTDVVESLRYVAQADITLRPVAEEIIAARILYELGYISESSNLQHIFTEPLQNVFATATESLLSSLQTVTATAERASQL